MTQPEMPVWTDPATGRRYTVDPASGQTKWLDASAPSRPEVAPQPSLPYSPFQQPRTSHTARNLLLIGGGVLVLLVVAVFAVLVVIGRGAEQAFKSAASASPTCVQLNGNCIATDVPTDTASPPTYSPAPTDFTIGVHVLSKECFGSAGCNITYRIDPTYAGQALDSSQSFTVTYTVKGGSDPQQGSFTITGTQANYDSQALIQTATSSDKLTVVVDEVIAN